MFAATKYHDFNHRQNSNNIYKRALNANSRPIYTSCFIFINALNGIEGEFSVCLQMWRQMFKSSQFIQFIWHSARYGRTTKRSETGLYKTSFT